MSANRRSMIRTACVLGAAAAVGASTATTAAADTARVDAAVAATAPAAQADIRDRLTAIDGMKVEEVEEGVPEGFRFFRLTFAQPVDHDDPSKGTFDQRLTLLHRDVSRPTVFYTSGYNVSLTPSRAEPTRLVDGNQVSMEYRYFTPSRPSDQAADWKKQLTIRQGAADQHRVYEALRGVYDRKWLATGGSKGGMTATYYRHFYPSDMSGTVAYVAPNDVVNDKDAYNAFLSRVGSRTCRADLVAVQRRALGPDRAWFVDKLTKSAAENQQTFTLTGGVDRAFEGAVVDTNFAFWQYQPASACGRVPDAESATREEIWAWFTAVNPLDTYSDQGLARYVPYYYQASVQLGWPQPYEGPLRGLLKYPGFNQAPSFVPDPLKPLTYDRAAMPAIDRWVRTSATQMLFLDGQLDPWSAEPFSCGRPGQAKQRDCHRFVVAGGNHGSTIQQLPGRQRTAARTLVRTWAGLAPTDRAVTRNGDQTRGSLDKPMVEQQRAM